MTDLEKIIDPSMGSSENENLIDNQATSDIPIGPDNERQGFQMDLPDNFQQDSQVIDDGSQELQPDLSNDFQQEPQVSDVNINNEDPSVEVNPSQVIISDPVLLGKLGNEMTNTVVSEGNPTLNSYPFEVSQSFNPGDQSQSGEQVANSHENTEEQNSDKSAQKEKLLQLINTHKSKAQKAGFLKGILSGVVLTVGVVILGGIFAKEQIIGVLNGLEGYVPLLASVSDLSNDCHDENGCGTNISDEEADDLEDIEGEESEEIDDEEEGEDIEDSDDEEEGEDIEDSDDEDEGEEIEDADDEDEGEEIEDADDEDEGEEIEDTDDEDEGEEIEDTDDEDEEHDSEDLSEELGYSIKHVDSEKDANRVLPSRCSDLTCYGEDKEFTPCEKFKKAENITEDANRIGHSGTCRYKDESELVYVEFK